MLGWTGALTGVQINTGGTFGFGDKTNNNDVGFSEQRWCEHDKDHELAISEQLMIWLEMNGRRRNPVMKATGTRSFDGKIQQNDDEIETGSLEFWGRGTWGEGIDARAQLYIGSERGVPQGAGGATQRDVHEHGKESPGER